MNTLSSSFFQRDDVILIAQELLGKVLVTNFDDQVTSGIIVEVEAYNGRTDKACHAYGGRRTKRTEVMYASGGIAYVYLCYGIHHLFNIVTNTEGLADAVLIRALQPIEGEKIMKSRLNSSNVKLTNGPGILSKSMGITVNHTGMDLSGNSMWIENAQPLSEDQIVATTRIGIDYAEEDALLPWRFYIRENPWVSRS